VQLAILALVAWFAWRVRSPFDALRLAVASYLGFALSGPLIAPHMFSPVLWLVLVATAVRFAGPSRATIGAQTAPAG